MSGKLAPHPDGLCGPGPTPEDVADYVASTLPQISILRALFEQGLTPTGYRLEYERWQAEHDKQR